MLAIQTILYPTDFSETSRYAFQLACSLARDHGARVIALHVAPPPQTVNFEGMPPSPALPVGYQEDLKNKLREFSAASVEVQVEPRLEEGFAATEIVRVAREVPCDLIVMGTHGRTGLGRLLLGSVAEHVLRKAPCPVLTVKAPPGQQHEDGHATGVPQASVYGSCEGNRSK